MCVSQCPDVTGIGVRANPVCIDEVGDVSRFDSLSNLNITADISSASDIELVVVRVYMHTHTHISHCAPVVDRPVLVQELTTLIAEEKCAPYYITSANSKYFCCII